MDKLLAKQNILKPTQEEVKNPNGHISKEIEFVVKNLTNKIPSQMLHWLILSDI